MLVSLQGVRINSVSSFFFLEQVSSDLLHVWVLVCCVFNFAVDCIRDYCPVVLCSSSCWGMTPRILEFCTLGVPLRQIWYSYDLSPCPPLSLLFSQEQKLSSWTSTLFFGGGGRTKYL